MSSAKSHDLISRKLQRQSRQRRHRKVWAALTSFLLVLPLVATWALPAGADDRPEYLDLTKSVSQSVLEPGQSFTYTVYVACQEADCENATLVDTLPAELEGWELEDVSSNPGESSVAREIHWAEGDNDLANEPDEIGPETTVTVNFTSVTDIDGTESIGMVRGTNFELHLRLRVPDDLDPGQYAATNTAKVTADNSRSAEDSADITVEVPVALAAEATKAWVPGEIGYSEGAPSTITLGGKNVSNVDVDRLVVQDPTLAEDGATELDADNPFTLVDFNEFDSVTMPEGTQVTVDAYVFENGVWVWKSGTAAGSPALPGGVDASDVGGLRFTYSSATADGVIEIGAEAGVAFEVAQRATHRNNSNTDLSAGTYNLTNEVGVHVESDEYGESDEAESTAPYTVTPPEIGVEITKNLNDDRIGAGESTSAVLVVSNGSEPVNELRVVEPGEGEFFTEEITLAGFSSDGINYPAGAVTGEVIYYFADDTEQTVQFDHGDTPDVPNDPITGFEIVFTAADGENGIEAAATTDIKFDIDTTEDATGAAASLVQENTARTVVTAVNGLDADHAARDEVEIIKPDVWVEVDKVIRPSSAVTVGDKVIASLVAKAGITARATLETITVEDLFNGDDDSFWNAFNLIGIAPTQIPADTKLTVQVQVGEDDWRDLDTITSESAAFIYSLNEVEFAAKVGVLNLEPSDLTGVRFVFDSEHNDGFANDTNLVPNPTFQVRKTTRIDGSDITDEHNEPKSYKNAVTANAKGESPNGEELEDSDGDDVDAGVITYPGGPGLLGIDKTWNNSIVPALTGQERTTFFTWRVAEGFETVTITDPAADESTPADTVFEAFDLARIQPIGASDVPYSNGWFLKYDAITGIELFDGDNWTPVPEPTGGWISGGSFVGYELTSDERDTTTGVRITLGENADARDAAHEVGDNFDAFAPVTGSGVGYGAARSFSLDWQLRDQTRSNSAWVTPDKTYNLDKNGEVRNEVALDGETYDGETPRDTASSDIAIVETPLNTKLDKKVELDPLPDGKGGLEGDWVFVPEPESDYRPGVTWTLEANTDSVTPATHLRVTDPVSCGADGAGCGLEEPLADPFTTPPSFDDSPFAHFDLTGLEFAASTAEQVDLDASKVWLLRYSETSPHFSTTDHTAAEVNDMDRAALADVVGYSVTFQKADAGTKAVGATITQDNRFTITVSTELRVTPRGETEPLAPGALKTIDVDNFAFAQSYNDILESGPNGDLGHAQTKLTGGDINVAVTKHITPNEIVRPAPDVPVTVTLNANQGTDPRSTLSPDTVTIEDQEGSEEFWNAFNFTGLSDVTFPTGANLAQIDLFGAFDGDTTPTWELGEPSGQPEVPSSISEAEFSDVTGIRITFSRDDGEHFDPTHPPAQNWNASVEFKVELRDTHRETGAEFEFNEEFDNTVSAISERSDGISSDKKTSIAPIVLSEGTQEIAVKKLTNDGRRFARAGEEVPFELSFENTGTGYLTITELRDSLPAQLIYLGTDPTFVKDADGLLSDDVTTTVDGQEIIFTWPEGENIMAPGETFTITLPLELQPALGEVVNPMVVKTVEALDTCGHIDGTDHWTQPGGETTCATDDYIEIEDAANLFTVKGVRGSLENTEFGGAYRLAGGQVQDCAANLTATGGDYFRSPCIAHSEVGGTDNWVLHAQNAGTAPIYEMTVFDQLPIPGDEMLVAGDSRGSQFRPELVGEPEVHVPDGTTVHLEVTFDDNVCNGAWSGLLGSGPICESAGEEWETAGSDTDWSAVTGIRVSLDFRTTPNEALVLGQSVDVTFQTVNTLASDASPLGAPAEVFSGDVIAWNQFGVKYIDTDRTRRSAPSKVGVHLRGASMDVVKAITGPASEYAADAFDADVQCYVGDIALDMGGYGHLALSGDNDYRETILGIPFSSVDGVECHVAERGEVGEYGETGRQIAPTSGIIPITEARDLHVTDNDEVTPESQIATLTNDYQFGNLAITKKIETNGDPTDFGPFDFELMCTTLDDQQVSLNGASPGAFQFTLAGDEVRDFTNVIPAGATCDLRELDSGADAIAITGSGATDAGDGAAVIEVATNTDVTVINTFEVEEPDDSDDPGMKDPSWLPRTGAEILTAVCIGLLFILAGVGLYRVRRNESRE